MPIKRQSAGKDWRMIAILQPPPCFTKGTSTAAATRMPKVMLNLIGL